MGQARRLELHILVLLIEQASQHRPGQSECDDLQFQTEWTEMPVLDQEEKCAWMCLGATPASSQNGVGERRELQCQVLSMGQQ